MTDGSRPHGVAGLPPSSLSGLFRAVEGLRNHRAFAAMLGCTVIGVLVAGIFSLLAAQWGIFFAALGAIAMFVAGAVGISAAGELLMDQARGVPSRGLGDAVAQGLRCIPRFILLALTLAAVAILVFVALGVAYLVCEIPVLGPILFVAVFPLSVVIAGLTLCGLFFCMILSLPAIWQGAPILNAVSQALAVARDRFVETLLMLIVVGLLAAVVGLIVCGVLFTGLVPTIAMAASLFGGEAWGSIVDAARAGGGVGSGNSYGLAAGIGGMLLWALIGTLCSLVYLLGLDMVYLRVTEGLDVNGTAAALKAGLEQARRQAAELGQRARDAAERARARGQRTTTDVPEARGTGWPPQEPSPPAPAPAAPGPETRERPVRAAPPESTAPAVAKTLTCPHCLAAVGQDDVYCAVCGQKL